MVAQSPKSGRPRAGGACRADAERFAKTHQYHPFVIDFYPFEKPRRGVYPASGTGMLRRRLKK